MNITFHVGVKLALSSMLIGSAAHASVLVGNATLGSVNTKRTVIVAQDGSGAYRTIQSAASAAQPGDLIQVKSGTYTEAPYLSVSGTAAAAIVVQNFPGQHPIIKAPGTDSNSRITISGSYIYFQGFEVTNGWDGIVVSGSYNAIIQNTIHNNGDSCANATQYCGDGVIVSSAHDVVLYSNNVYSNGLLNYSPSHVHGIYLSDYYECGCMKNITIANNQISNHGGGGIHIWDLSSPKTAILIQDNVFQNNTYELVLYGVSLSTITGNTFNHSGHPATDARIDTILWFEVDANDSLAINTFNYGVTAPTPLNYLIYLPTGIGGLSNLSFENNTWNLPSSLGITVTDAVVNSSL